MQGSGVVPAVLSITESDPYDFGLIPTGGQLTHIFTISNTGGFTASGVSEIGLAAPFLFTGGAFPGINGTCTANIFAASNCDIELEFAPTVTGLQLDTINFQYFDGAKTSFR